MFDLEFELPELTGILVTPEALQRYGRLAIGDSTAVEPRDTTLTAKLHSMTHTSAIGQVRDKQLADCCLAGIWLLHGHLDASHDISQSIKTREGSFWHAIMHRLEHDFWNSQYWYQNVGHHPVVQALQTEYASYPDQFLSDSQSVVAGNPTNADYVAKIAIDEWKSLFEHCFANALDSQASSYNAEN